MLDVDGLLDTVSPKQFDEWVAYKLLEPDKLDRQREILTRGLVYLCNAWGGEIEMKDIDPYYEEPKSEPKDEYVSPQRAFDLLKATLPGA